MSSGGAQTVIFSGLFSKEGRDRLRREAQYENCKALRKKLIQRIALFTVEDIRSIHPDATFMFPTHGFDFLAVSQKSEAFIGGHLDNKIPDVTEKVPYEKLHGPFTSSLGHIAKMATEGTVAIVENHLKTYDLSKQAPKEWENSAGRWVAKPQYQYQIFELGQVSRLTVRKNGRIILDLNPLNGVVLNEIMQRLHTGIVYEWIENGERGITQLDVKVEVAYEYTIGYDFGLSLFYDDRKLSPTNNDRRHLTHIYDQLSPMIATMASFMAKAEYDESLLRFTRSSQQRDVA
ncbi:hypothetical protein [Rhizobium laguerreae]|uniref:hypothetical protein n=1 Tax=Rhizobium laguerreae TaxID=1076926 RepID=UPI001C92B536|nr:hypothetical protein [Rhizobium laguerreae]MBY3112096.1 hypothetical protein [Rhizobium laguerreae]